MVAELDQGECIGVLQAAGDVAPSRQVASKSKQKLRVAASNPVLDGVAPANGQTPTKFPTHENLGETRHPTLSSSKTPSAHGTRFLPADDELLTELKEKRGLPWSQIMKHFPGRTKGSLQVPYGLSSSKVHE